MNFQLHVTVDLALSKILTMASAVRLTNGLKVHVTQEQLL